jgi:hypothetical protein
MITDETDPGPMAMRSGSVPPSLAEQNPAAPLSELAQEVVTPLMKLQQLVKLCATVLRESREMKAAEPDPELGEVGVGRRPGVISDSTATHYEIGVFGTGFRVNWEGMDESCKAFCEKIWAEVEPPALQYLWSDNASRKLGRVPVITEEEIEQHGRFHLPIITEGEIEPLGRFASIVRKCRTKEDIPLLFEKNRIIDNARASSLAWQCNKLESSDLDGIDFVAEHEDWSRVKGVPVNTGLLVVLFRCRDEGNSSIGNILEMSYQYCVLEQPTSSDPRDYIKHILQIVESAQLASEVLYFGSVARNSSNAPANALASALSNAVIVDPLCKTDEL